MGVRRGPMALYFGMDRDGFYWCEHCRQASTAESWDKGGGLCPTEGCDGAKEHAHPWGKIRQKDKTGDYDEVPVAGRPYPYPWP